ncbi:MAG TPA: dockerin type I repeat-containing protein [archaeon]|nr:dockerin type I repeat-containing protein [archaeon]
MESCVSKPGDINQDGSLNGLDLVALVQQLSGTKPLTPQADLDGNGALNIFDMLALLRQKASFMVKSTEEEFQFLILIENHVLTEPKIYPFWSVVKAGEISYGYHIYSNRYIEKSIFILGPDTLTGVGRKIPPPGIGPAFSPDTMKGVHGRTPVLMNPDTSVTWVEDRVVSIGPLSWHVRIKDSEENWTGNSGVTQIIARNYSGVEVNIGYPPLLGLEIDFPLVLKGPWQRFQLELYGIERRFRFLTIDLNRSCKDSVIFTNIDSLSQAIMEEVIQNDTLTYETGPDIYRSIFSGLFVSPAIDLRTGNKSDRLILDNMFIGGNPFIKAADGNEILINKLGFPGWLPPMPFEDHNYEFDESWYEKYKAR